eukprot:3674084-Rhodomonas_salina.1
MQTLRERSQVPPRNVPASARQAEYVDQGIAARRGRAHARMDCPSPTGSEPDNRRFREFRDRRERREFSDMFGQTFGKIVAKYCEEYNILNTIIHFEGYMANHSISMEKYSQYAVSYFDEIIQLWYDGLYTDTPAWAQLRRDLIS